MKQNSKKKETFVFLGLGSNMGNRKLHLKQACTKLSSHPKIQIKKTSSLYETDPIGPKQRRFLNAVIQIKTELTPGALLRLAKKIEKIQGRKKTVFWGPRPLDVDILLFGHKMIHTPSLTIPHPQLHKRRFVLVPLKEIASTFKHRGLNKTISELCGRLTPEDQKVRLFGSFPR